MVVKRKICDRISKIDFYCIYIKFSISSENVTFSRVAHLWYPEPNLMTVDFLDYPKVGLHSGPHEKNKNG